LENEELAMESNSSSEQLLWINFKQGSEKALAAIYSLYFNQLYDYGFKFSQDSNLVEDCIQELFIKLIRNKKNLAIPNSVKGYLIVALRSQLLDKIKQTDKARFIELDDALEFKLELNPESAIIKKEQLDENELNLHLALDTLTSRQREAIFLKYQEGLAYPEIAQILSLSQKATYKLIARGIQALRTALKVGST
jgi:RNA polymerase sigma factor (sigma-70 family)